MEKKQNKEFEQKDPLWIAFHRLENKIKNKENSINNISYNLISLANNFLDKYTKKDDLEEIFIAFENLVNTFLYIYGNDAKNLYENDKEGEILSSFDSLIFNYEYKQEIKKLKVKIKEYLVKNESN